MEDPIVAITNTLVYIQEVLKKREAQLADLRKENAELKKSQLSFVPFNPITNMTYNEWQNVKFAIGRKEDGSLDTISWYVDEDTNKVVLRQHNNPFIEMCIYE